MVVALKPGVIGTKGIILRGFKYIKNRIDKPAERMFPTIYQWLECGFPINSEIMILMLHAVVNLVNEHVWWELLFIPNTIEWKVYINEALECGWSFTISVRSHTKS
jgi:hypothetical protein